MTKTFILIIKTYQESSIIFEHCPFLILVKIVPGSF